MSSGCERAEKLRDVSDSTISLQDRAHITSCDECAERVRELRHIAALARKIPIDEADDERRERIRATLMIAAPNLKQPVARRRSAWTSRALVLGAAAAAAIALFHFSGRAPEMARARKADSTLRVSIDSHPGAAFERRGPDSNQIVRVTDGTIALDVEHLMPGQRFRVLSGDAELEVRGTRFEVSVERDRLRRVRVIEGRVEIRRQNEPSYTLGPGEHWEAKPESATGSQPFVAPAASTGSETVSVSRVARREKVANARSGDAVENEAPRAEQRFQEGFEAMRRGDSARAAAAFEESVRAGDSSVAEDAAFWRAVALSKNGEREKAVTALRAFLAAYPASARRDQARALLANLDHNR